MKQSLVIFLVVGLFMGCAKHSNKNKLSADYDYLFDGNLVPVNSDQERTRVLNQIGEISKLPRQVGINDILEEDN